MTHTISILGRQSGLGLAELESLYGHKAVQPVGQVAALITADPKDVPIDRLGGSMKIAKHLTDINSTELPAIIKYISDNLPKYFQNVPTGKITIGLSFYGFNVNPGKINAYALTLKKNLKSSQRGVRLVPNKAPDLNTAQVIHNRLTGPNGMELLLIKRGKRTVMAQTVEVQDIEAYAARDQARPKRDAKVGMLPPKLAQIIVNLATGEQTQPGRTVLDPFCGTGVLLQESLLMGYNAYGTDLEPRMIEYSQINLDWLANQYKLMGKTELSVGDATEQQWNKFDVLACETYLGRPFSAIPKPEVLSEVIQDVDTIHRKFLRNVARQTPAGFRMTIAVPAWKTERGFKHLSMLDSLEELGYNRVSFVHARDADLLYFRDNQVVARELVTLIRK